jgi:chemotaxis signal transduction protein
MSSAQAERQVVVFSLLGEAYALPIASVREIIRYTPPRATATARGLIRGMITLRDRLLPLVDLSSLLGGQIEIGSGSRILILEVSNAALAIVVDSVNGIVRLTADQVTPLPAAANRELGEEVAAAGDRLIVLLEPERVALAAGVTAPAPRTSDEAERSPYDGP